MRVDAIDRGGAAATVNLELATLSHVFNRAVEWKWLDRLPSRPKKLAESGGRIIALIDDECDELMRAAIAGADPDLWLSVAFGLNTYRRGDPGARANDPATTRERNG
jgi:hypothetical protein